MSELYPPGINHLADLPYPLHEAILRALMYLSWDELPKEERPPRRMWLDGEALSSWFAEVERRREEKYGNKGDAADEDMDQNQAAKDLLVG